MQMALIRVGDKVQEDALAGVCDSAVLIQVGVGGLSITWAGAGMDLFRALGVVQGAQTMLMQRLLRGEELA